MYFFYFLGIFQARTDGVTTGATATGFKDISGIDLVYKYFGISGQTYSTATGFKAIGGADLNTLFQWGGYTATVSASNKSSTFNTISFTISGSYNYISVFKKITSPISGATLFVPISYSSPYSYTTISLIPNTSYTFTIRAYNGFDIFSSLSFDFSTAQIIAPTVSFTNITGVSSTSYTIQFAYSGGAYTTCSIRSYTDNTYTAYSSLGTISYSSSGTFTTSTLSLNTFYIKFVPLDSNSNEGTASTGMSKTKANTSRDYTTVQTNTSFTLQVFTYNVFYILIGGGGSGGSGGGNGFADCPDGGGGGGGGAGTVVGNTNLNLTGSSSQQGGVLTVGAGGSGVSGVFAGLNQALYGNNGNNGGNSQLNFTNIIVYNASNGTGGFGGEGAHTHTTQFGGAGGSIGGVSGSNDGGAGGAGGSTSYGYGNGSNGSKGETRNVSSSATSAAINGKVSFTEYYFV